MCLTTNSQFITDELCKAEVFRKEKEDNINFEVRRPRPHRRRRSELTHPSRPPARSSAWSS
jgi:hypothetical protein